MNDVMKIVLSMSLSASLLILLLVLVLPLCRNRLSRSWQYYVWLIVVLRLLLPFTPADSPVGALFRDNVPAQVTDGTLLPQTDIPAPAAPKENSKPSAPAAPKESSKPPAAPPGITARALLAAITEYLWIVWLAGAVLSMARRIFLYKRFTRCIRSGREAVSGGEHLLEGPRAQAGIKRPVELWVNPAAPSPMLIGWFHPAIVLPALKSPEELHGIALHELVHLKRWDMLYKWLVQAALCVHWFNPLVYLMEREIRRNCELSCDEAVLSLLEAPERRAYGDALLRAARPAKGYPASIALSEDGKFLRERLNAIMTYRKHTKAAALISVILTAALFMGTAAAGVYAVSTDVPDPENVLKREEIPEAAIKDGEYTQNWHYRPPYLFEIAWNLTEDAQKDYSRRQMTLGTGKTLTVCFSEECTSFMDSSTAVKCLAELLSDIDAETGFPLIRPLIVDVEDVSGSTPEELAARYYETEESLPRFTAVFPFLSADTQEAYLDRMYTDRKTGYFSSSIRKMKNSGEAAAEYAERACKDNQTGFFAICMEMMEVSGEALKGYIETAYQNENTPMFSVCLEAMANPERTAAAYAERACKDDKTGFFPICIKKMENPDETLKRCVEAAYQDENASMLSACLEAMTNPEATAAAYAERACADDETALFAVCIYTMENPDETAAKCAETAYQNGNIAIFTVCLGAMANPGETAAVYAERAYQDGRASFFSVASGYLSWEHSSAHHTMTRHHSSVQAELEENESDVLAYAAHGITCEDRQYFYQGERVRLLADLRADASFAHCFQDNTGTADVKIQRDAEGKVVSVSPMPAEEAAAFLSDLRDEEDWEGGLFGT